MVFLVVTSVGNVSPVYEYDIFPCGLGHNYHLCSSLAVSFGHMCTLVKAIFESHLFESLEKMNGSHDG
jgi:hypothetical protein